MRAYQFNLQKSESPMRQHNTILMARILRFTSLQAQHTTNRMNDMKKAQLRLYATDKQQHICINTYE